MLSVPERPHASSSARIASRISGLRPDLDSWMISLPFGGTQILRRFLPFLLDMCQCQAVEVFEIFEQAFTNGDRGITTAPPKLCDCLLLLGDASCTLRDMALCLFKTAFCAHGNGLLGQIM